MKKVSKTLINKIEKINSMIEVVNSCDEIATTYAGGTFPYYVELTQPIEVKNQFVYIKEYEQQYKYGFDKRYNVNNEGSFEMLKYDLTQILKAFNQVIKNN